MNCYARAEFASGVHTLRQLPADEGREVAFAGRSNAGKSSALNAVTGRKGLARISKTPGRTQQINFFQIDPTCYLVDLPGYGFAKAPVELRRHWDRLMQRYLAERSALRGLVLVMDVRHPLGSLDLRLLRWCGARQLPVHVLLTKGDKLGRGAARATLLRVQAELAKEHGPFTTQLFSARTREGVEGVRALLDRWFELAADDRQ